MNYLDLANMTIPDLLKRLAVMEDEAVSLEEELSMFERKIQQIEKILGGRGKYEH